MVGVDRFRTSREFGLESNSLLLRNRCHPTKDFRSHLPNGDRLWSRLPMSGLDSRKVEELVNYPLHPLGAGENCPRKLDSLVLPHVGILQRLGETAHYREWSAKLVRHVCHEIPPHRLELSNRRKVE